MLFSAEDKNAALQIVSSLVFWFGYLATRYAVPSERTGPSHTAAQPPRRVTYNTTRRAVTLWCFLALLINVIYFSAAITTTGKMPADVSARLWFCATQLFSASYNVWQELHDTRRTEPLSAQAIRHMYDGAFLPVLCMTADFIARGTTSSGLYEIAYYAQSPLWIAFHSFATSQVEPA